MKKGQKVKSQCGDGLGMAGASVMVLSVLVEVPQAAVAAGVRPLTVQVDVDPGVAEGGVAAVAVGDPLGAGDRRDFVHQVDRLLPVDQLLLADEAGQPVVAGLELLPGVRLLEGGGRRVDGDR